MHNQTKIGLSAKELELVINTDWILTKKIIIKKVIDLFGLLLLPMQQITTQYKSNLPSEFHLKDPKIYKGESYKELPYVMLDYPRYFEKENTLAIRTLFWWGNFFSVSLQLSGEIKRKAIPNLMAAFLQMQNGDFWICINDHPWEHNFDNENYVPIDRLSLEEFNTILNNKLFVKISKKMSLQQWDGIALFIEQTFTEMILIFKTNYPNGETDL